MCAPIIRDHEDCSYLSPESENTESASLSTNKSLSAEQALATASAFVAPKATSAPKTVVKADYSGELGVLPPVGFFDPAGLSSNIDEETFAQYRTAELKHGRVAQLAVLGYVAAETYRWPGEIAPGLKFADVPNGVAAINAIPALGWLQMVFFIGLTDYWGIHGNFDSGKPALDDEELAKRQTQELQHGRLAMLATLELLRHDSQNMMVPGFDGLDHLITGLPFIYQ